MHVHRHKNIAIMHDGRAWKVMWADLSDEVGM